MELEKTREKALWAGFDVGGTKCAVVLGEEGPDGDLRVVEKRRFETDRFSGRPLDCLGEMCRLMDEELAAVGATRADVGGVGISCGGPLDARRGVVLSPPNLPGWIDVPAVAYVRERTGLPARLENDANACALAEWRQGAGRGVEDMVFLTMGTGMGAGIIAGGHLVSGVCGLGGECGHLRLADDGPVGFGKAGSFEGFCSGGGLARQGRAVAEAAIAAGRPPVWCPGPERLPDVSAKLLAEAARGGDALALGLYRSCGTRLGQALSLLVDTLNPARIVIGSIFVRAEELLRPSMEEAMRRDCIPAALAVCQVVPAALGESLGDIAALVLAAGQRSSRCHTRT